MTKPPRGFFASPGAISHLCPPPNPQASVPHWTGRTSTHRRGTLEFGSAVGEVVGGRLMAHWFQLRREKGNLDYLQGWGSPPC